MRHPVGRTRNDVPVFVDLIRSKAATHISQQPHLLGLVEEVLRSTTVRGPGMNIERNMGRSIGYNFVVETTDNDSVLYAQQLQEDIYTRFVKNGKPLPTQYLTIVLQRADDATYDLVDTWIGRLSPPRPGSADETDDSKTYWKDHAFVLRNEPLQLRTVTKVCPY
jgi:hypothetical protein